MKISIIGLGLIGGSFALALKEIKKSFEITGWDHDPKNLHRAVELGLVEFISADLKSAVSNGELIILAIPVDAIEAILPQILNQLEDHQVVVDFGSTKAKIAKTIVNHPKRKNYIAAHPIAGTEYSGPDSAVKDLYSGKTMILCDQELSDTGKVKMFSSLCHDLGMNLTVVGSEEHDMHLAYVSHLSHIMAFSLSATVMEKEKESKRLLELAGSGFDSTVRLAKSSPDMWTPIFLKNKDYLLESLGAFKKNIIDFEAAIKNEDSETLHKFLTDARHIRDILK